jgi:hypothetical protein
MATDDAQLNALRDELTGQLRAVFGESTPVVDDVRDVNPPCVLVGAPRVTLDDPRTWRVLIPVHVLTPPPAHGDAVRWMLDSLGAVMTGVPGVGDAEAIPYPTSERDLPSYTATITRFVAIC